jgi:hypothetical protein
MDIDKITFEISQSFENGELNNENMVQIIELCGLYLNLKTISDYAKENGITYNGAKRFRNNVTIFNTKFIIDNS